MCIGVRTHLTWKHNIGIGTTCKYKFEKLVFTSFEYSVFSVHIKLDGVGPVDNRPSTD